MLSFGGKTEFVTLETGNKALTAVYSGVRLIWEAIRSCFGAGYWVNEKPWLNDEAWKND